MHENIFSLFPSLYNFEIISLVQLRATLAPAVSEELGKSDSFEGFSNFLKENVNRRNG